MLCFPVLLSGCGMGGFSLEKAEVDRSLLTGSVASASQTTTDPERASDEATIRNAVTSADLEGLAGAPLAWANADTGSRGAISNVIESRDNGALCRKFTTSRESYDGVGLYHGEVCKAGAGLWRMLDFQPAT
ncbi:outer membrane surface antigen [Pseudaminobacter salicylatoxidans]|uniref:Outer membrane surface antigen n=1 Tax=Pseudaminobacter salicylatoxidans TaxID=93369 RepID=A0A316C875_PSESE|nr:RT0821/Lpp0805 family surface protein [Pseudaminobacter salicylatoxidans]PWJ85443.1 outer membrane surface antigen [Pseudaminobacter salicylatoxidans]